jgi:nitroreductase
MNELLKVFEARRSIRKYTGEPIPEEKLQAILSAGLLAASGKNKRPWELVLVREKLTLAKLSKCRMGGVPMLMNADAAVVVLGDTRKTDTTVEDCSIALANMHLMASGLGVGSCWIQGRMRQADDGSSAEEYLRSLLGYPPELQLIAVLALGMPEEHPAPRPLTESDWAKVHKEQY